MNNRRYVVMGGSIIGIIIVLLVSMVILSSCTAKKGYTNTEKEMINAAKKYINDEKATVLEGSQLILYDTVLVDAGYLKSLSSLTKDDSCSGSVLVMNNGGQYNYLPSLTCTNYKTSTIKDKIINDNLTTKDDGIYASNGEYIFKGKNPNNHLLFAGQNWFIIKINSDGTLKLISAEQSNQIIAWDNKFNEDTDYASGENDYESSDLYKYLIDLYKGFKDEPKSHLVPFNVCIGRRESDNLIIGENIDCAETLSNQYLGLLTPTDYAKASYDKDCTDILKGSCTNFNYLYENLGETWTTNALAGSTYEAILYNAGRFSAVTTRKLHNYYVVINISGNELYDSGDGSVDNPYTIK